MNDTPETNNERTLKIALEVFTELAKTLKQERDEARGKLVKVENERDHWKKIASAFEVLMPPVGGKRILKIIERDGWKCAYCGVETCFNGWDGPMPTVDHITPKAKGGLDHIANCVVACKDCNSAKSDQENWSPNTGEQKEKKTWAWEDGKFRKKTEK
jgi:CRISPR/Cas system Type II protein with McrA/HNH and RuvC-like nuclease domain